MLLSHAFAALVLGASTITARHVMLTWRDQGADTGTFQWAGDMGPVKSIKYGVADDGTPMTGYVFFPDLDPRADGSLLRPKCKVVGKLDAGKEFTSFEFQQGTNYLNPCNLKDGVAVVCEDPQADCKPFN